MIVLHVPHASTVVPDDVRRSFLLSDGALAEELLLMTDRYTEELFSLDDAARHIVFPVSRLVVDPERFLDDALEPMSSRGMGAVYTRTSQGLPLRAEPDPEEKAALLRRFYEPHHLALTEAVDSALDRSGTCLVIDCHSFPSRPLPYETDQNPDRPDICIGTDDLHTPPWLTDHAESLFRRHGLRVERDRPFSGALVPQKHHRINRSVMAVMIELNRRLYMDESTGERTRDFEPVRDLLATVVRELSRRAENTVPYS